MLRLIYIHIYTQLFGRPHRLGLHMVVCVECLPANKPWDVVSVTRRSSGVVPRACARVRACAGIAESLHTYIHKIRIAVIVYIRHLGREERTALGMQKLVFLSQDSQLAVWLKLYYIVYYYYY